MRASGRLRYPGTGFGTRGRSGLDAHSRGYCWLAKGKHVIGTQAVALVRIDLQYGFFEEQPLSERRDGLVENANALAACARGHEPLMATVRTEHRADPSTWTLNMFEDDQGFAIESQPSAQPLPHLDLLDRTEVTKTRDDAFFGTDLLRGRNIETIVPAGVSAHSRIATTAARAHAEDSHVVLARDAIAASRPEGA